MAPTKLLWKPLLAATLPMDSDLDKLPYPLLGSPKLDGYRVMIQRARAVSRKGIEYRNKAVQRVLGLADLEGLDGEVCIGPPWAKDVFNRTQNCVNSGSEEAAQEFSKHGAFHVFGWYDAMDPAEESGVEVNTPQAMFQALSERGDLVGHPYVKLVKQKLIRNASQLRSFEATMLEKGYEGVMLRRMDCPAYPQKPGKDNRSTLNEFWLVKLKRFDYGEARIIACHYLEHNKNEERTESGKRSTKRSGIVIDKTQVGRVSVVETETREPFSLTVPTNLLRQKGMDWWTKQIGKTVRYKYQVAGMKDAPRICTSEFKELL